MVLKFTKIFKCKIKLWKKLQSFFKNSQSKRWLNRGIYGVNPHRELNVKTLHAEVIHFN